MQCGSSLPGGIWCCHYNSPVPMLPLWLLQVLHQDVVVRGLEIYQDQRSKILMLEEDKNKGQRQSTWRSVWISKVPDQIINFYYYNIIITSIRIVIFFWFWNITTTITLYIHYHIYIVYSRTRNSVVPLPILVPRFERFQRRGNQVDFVEIVANSRIFSNMLQGQKRRGTAAIL